MSEALSTTSESGGFERMRQPADMLIGNEVGRQRMFLELRKAGLANPNLTEDCSSLRDHILNYASSERMGLDVSMLKDEILKAYEEIVGKVATPEVLMPEQASAQEAVHIAEEKQETIESASPIASVFTPAVSERRRGPFLIVDNAKPEAQPKDVVADAPVEDVTEEVHAEPPVVEVAVPEIQKSEEEAEVGVPAANEAVPDAEALRHEVEHIHQSLQGVCTNPLSLTGCKAYKTEYLPARIHIVDRLFDKNVTAGDLTDVSQKIEELRTAADRVREEFGVWENTPTSAEVSEPTPAQVVESIAATPEQVTPHVVPEVASGQPAPAVENDHRLRLVQMMKSKEITEALEATYKAWTKKKGGILFHDPTDISKGDLKYIVEKEITIEQIKNNDLPLAMRPKVAENTMQNIAARVESFAKETGVEPHDAETLEYYLRRALSEQSLAEVNANAAPLAKAA